MTMSFANDRHEHGRVRHQSGNHNLALGLIHLLPQGNTTPDSQFGEAWERAIAGEGFQPADAPKPFMDLSAGISDTSFKLDSTGLVQGLVPDSNFYDQ
jgi:hypothetical protein